MPRKLTPRSSLESLKREAKRWLAALRANDPTARARLERALPDAPATPGLRDVQLALAREHGFPGWTDLKREVAAIEAGRAGNGNAELIRELFESAGRGDVARVRAVLDAHPELVSARPPRPGHDGARTALHFAVAHPEVVRLLLERGADPNVRDDGDDAMPLHFAAERGDLQVVRLLVEHGADTVGDGTMHELNVLGWAICWDYVHNQEVAEYLLAHGARHTIHTAVALGDVRAIRDIAARAPGDLDKPMDRTNLRRRPLHLAVIKGRPDSLAALLELGADPGAEDASGLTPLDQAALSGDDGAVDLLLRHGAEVRLPAAIFLNRMADVERLLREDRDVLKPGGRWASLILRAAERASGDVVERLIRAGASVDARDDSDASPESINGFTPLHAAAFRGNSDAVRVLLRHGADPNVRESKWCATAAGWASYAGHREARDLLLEARVDLFQAIDFDVPDRIPAIARQSPWLLERRFRECAACAPRPNQWFPEPWHTPLAWAVAKNKPEAVRALLEQGAALIPAPDGRGLQQVATDAGYDQVATLLREHERSDATHAGRVRLFVRNACPDHAVRGAPAHAMARGTAERLLRRYPEIARDSLYTAIICGDLDEVRRALSARPEAARERGGPNGWEPLLYLCFTRLSLPAARDNAVAIARALLDHGADPNAHFMAGDSRYTPLVGAVGEGEEDRPPHPQRDALVRLLLERGAEPYDMQVVYNVHFRGDILWWMELMYEHALRLGRQADWDDPEWRMLDMGPYGSGARWHLEVALTHNNLALAEWLLSHGASPNSPPARDQRFPQRSLYAEALRRGLSDMAALLARYGAAPLTAALEGEDAFAAACLRLDREAARALADAHPEYLRSTAVMFEAARHDRADVVALLLDLGMSPDVEDSHRERPLHVAAYHEAVRTAALLIERGATIDPVDARWHSTPLGYAVHAQRSRTIDLLSRHSRDVWALTFTGNVERLREILHADPDLATVKTDSGATPLMWLPDDETRALEIAELLIAHGADRAARTQHGETAAAIARRRGMEELAERLQS